MNVARWAVYSIPATPSQQSHRRSISSCISSVRASRNISAHDLIHLNIDEHWSLPTSDVFRLQDFSDKSPRLHLKKNLYKLNQTSFFPSLQMNLVSSTVHSLMSATFFSGFLEIVDLRCTRTRAAYCMCVSEAAVWSSVQTNSQKGKGKGMSSLLASTAHTRRHVNSSASTISELTIDWQELVIPRRSPLCGQSIGRDRG